MKKLIFFLVFVLSMSYLMGQPIIDSSGLRTRVNVDIVPNITKSITAAKVNRIMNGYLNIWPKYSIDSLKISNDSVFFRKNNIWVFSHKVSTTNIPLSALAITGTPDGTKFLRDDYSWQTIPGGSGISALTTDVVASGTGSVTATIQAGVVTLAKMANIATGTFIGRNAAGTGVPQALSVATVQVMLGVSGVNTGDQTITLTGPITGSGTGSIATTIATNAVTYNKIQNISASNRLLGRSTAGVGNVEEITVGGDIIQNGSTFTITNNTVTLAKLQDIGTSTFIGRSTAGTGDPEILSVATARTVLNIGSVENTALSTWIGSTNLITLGSVTSGQWQATPIDAAHAGNPTGGTSGQALVKNTGTNYDYSWTTLGLGLSDGNKGDITSASGATVITVNANAITLAKMQQIATASFLARNTGGTGNVEVISVATAKTLLSVDLVDNTSDVTKWAATATLTNKRITQRVGTTASGATITPSIDSHDEYNITALATNATIAAPTGTPVNGQFLLFRFKDNGVARTLTWNAIYRASTDFALPSSTTAGKTMYVQFVFNGADTKYDCTGLTNGF